MHIFHRDEVGKGEYNCFTDAQSESKSKPEKEELQLFLRKGLQTFCSYPARGFTKLAKQGFFEVE